MIFPNLRSTCSLGIIASFVLFLATSAPHRVHHFFENLPYPLEVLPEETQPLTLAALPSAEPADRDHLSDHHPANEDHHDHAHVHFHNGPLSHNDDHKHDQSAAYLDHSPFEPQEGSSSHGDDPLPTSEAPLHANTPHNNAHHDGSAHTVCLLQGAAQHAHLSNAQLAEIAFLGIESEKRPPVVLLGFALFNPSPFSQRAPPNG